MSETMTDTITSDDAHEPSIHVHRADIRPLYELAEKLADTEHPLALEATELVTRIQASQYDRNPLTWTLEPGQRHFRDGGGNFVPRGAHRYVTDEVALAHLAEQREAAYPAGLDDDGDQGDDGEE
jgi:hypothetical protein